MRRIWRLYPVLLLLSVAMPAWPQAEDLFELSLEDLLDIKIVSASKYEDTLKDIPNTVTIITREDIAVMGYASLEELLMNLPSVYHIDNYEDFLIGIRGVVGGSIAFLINGVQQHPTRIKGLTIPDRSRTNIPIDSIDRIEFVRGPSSVIYGNNAFLGSINIVTNDTSGVAGKATAASGSNGYGRAFVRLSKEFNSGNIVANLGGTQTQGIGGNIDAMLSSEQREKIEEQYPGYKQNLDGTLEHENYNLDVSGAYHRVQYGLRYSKMQYGFYALGPPNQDGAKLQLSSWVANLAFEQPLANNLSASFFAIASNEDYDAHPDYWVNTDEGFQHQSANRYEFESIIKYDTDAIRGVLGLNYRRLEDITSEINIQVSPEGDRFQKLRSSEAVDTLGIFANANLKITDAFSLVGGYRYSATGDYTLFAVGDGVELQDEVREIPQMSNNAVKLALLYDLSSAQSIKASYSTATQDNRSTTLFEPEQIATWEINYSYASANINVSSSAFVNRTERIHRLYQQFGDAQFGKSEDNTGEWHTRGLEFIALIRPSKRFTLELSSVFQKTEDKAVSEDIPIGNSPELVAKFKFGYGFTSWKLAGSLEYVDDMLADYRVSEIDASVARYGAAVQSYLTLNGNIRYQKPDSDWYINIHAFNFTNEDIRYTANELVSFYLGTYGPSRQLSLAVGVDF